MPVEGVFGVYKPLGPSSNQFLQKLKKFWNVKKIGHAGTLDPLASGVLVVGVGRTGTKQLADWKNQEKEYRALIKLGITSTTDDDEGEKIIHENYKIPSSEDVNNILQKFRGEILQTPPIYSAVHVRGKRAYALARAGKFFELQPRKVHIISLQFLRYEWPFLEIQVETGSGVYIRALARDIGKVLGTGAYLAQLERTRVGRFSIATSIKV